MNLSNINVPFRSRIGNHIEVPSGTYDLTNADQIYLEGLGSITAVGGPVTFIGRDSGRSVFCRMQPGSGLSLKGVKFVNFQTVFATERISGATLGWLNIDKCQFEDCTRVVYAREGSPGYEHVDIRQSLFLNGKAPQILISNGVSKTCNITDLDFRGGFSRCILVGCSNCQDRSALTSIRNISIKGLRGYEGRWRGDIHAIFVIGHDAEIRNIRGEDIWSDVEPDGGVHNDVCTSLIYTDIIRGSISGIVAHNCGGQGNYGTLTCKGVAPEEQPEFPDSPLTSDLCISDINITIDDNWPPHGEQAGAGIRLNSPYCSLSGAHLVGCNFMCLGRGYQLSLNDVDIRNRAPGRDGFMVSNFGGVTRLTGCRDSFPHPDNIRPGYNLLGFEPREFLGPGEFVLEGCMATNYQHKLAGKIALTHGGPVAVKTTGLVYSDDTVTVPHDEQNPVEDETPPDDHVHALADSIGQDIRAKDEIYNDIKMEGDPE